MKKVLLIITSLLIMASSSFAQLTYADFESQEPTGYVFGGNTYTPGIDNPDQSGNNTSSKVAWSATGGETWSGLAMPIGGTIDFAPGDTTFTMDVYSAVSGTVLFKLENTSNSDIAVEVSQEYTATNTWETMEFAFPDTVSADTYGQIVLFFNEGTTDSTNWYFDNIIGPSATFGSDVDVNLIVEDKSGNASSVSIDVNGSNISLTEENNDVWTDTTTLAPYTMPEGGGEYEAIINVNGEPFDTTLITVTGDAATMDWNYLLLDEEPEDGTADAINVGDTPPTIDGEIDAVWDSAKTHTMQQRGWYGSPTGLYSKWKIMWDTDNVYLLYIIEDDTPYAENTDSLFYKNDNVETFFDMDQSASEGYDNNDWQIRTVRNSDVWSGSENVDSTWASDLERAQNQMENNEGYIIEMAIPWISLSSTFLPLEGEKFNYDCNAADVTAESGARVYIESWATDEDIAYKNTSKFGTITLVGGGDDGDDDETSINQTPESLKNIKMYPNPAQKHISLENLKDVKTVSICNVLGATIKEVPVNNERMNINVEGLNEGIYFVIFRNEKGQSNSLKLLKE